MAGVSDPDFWERLYADRGDRWELGRPAPPLVEMIETTPPPRGRVAVPGCGRGHDARYLARQGYEVVGFDFSPAAVAAARDLAAREGVAVTFEERDIFALPVDFPHAFDGIWEYVSFCAVDPRRRPEYVRVMHAILRPGGWFLACFFPLGVGMAGPPFPVTRGEVGRLLRPWFRLERTWTPIRSVRPRQGREWMVLARKPA